jgi:hypothetical protein
VCVETGCVEELELELELGAPLVWVETGSVGAAGALAGAGAGAGAGATAGAAEEGEGGEDAAACSCRAGAPEVPPWGRTWIVRWTTWVCTFGFPWAAAEDAGVDSVTAWLFARAYPPRPPRPSIVAPAAIFILRLLTVRFSWVG